ncbi:MAG: hypothetical protein QM503_03270 [Bacteroidota bacterium]
MVRIEKNKLIIEIETNSPAIELGDIQRALIEIIARAGSASSEGGIYNDNGCYTGVSVLLHELQLDELQIKKALGTDE